MGGQKELIRFWWPWPYFQGHTSRLKCHWLLAITRFLTFHIFDIFKVKLSWYKHLVYIEIQNCSNLFILISKMAIVAIQDQAIVAILKFYKQHLPNRHYTAYKVPFKGFPVFKGLNMVQLWHAFWMFLRKNSILLFFRYIFF